MLYRIVAVFFCGLALLVLPACEKLSPQQEHFASAYKKFNEGDFASALLYLKPLVESGHPAAELLMAKMYANGEGVPEDQSKAELLRNLAAFQIYKNKDITPGEMRPANETLKAISDRLDYYVGEGEGKKAPAQNLDDVLKSVDLKGISDLQKLDSDNGVGPPDVQIDIPHEKIPGHEEETVPPGQRDGAQYGLPLYPKDVGATSSAPEEMPTEAPSVEPVKDVQVSGVPRRADQITLGIVRKAADEGDPMAMELLSAAYAHSFYGLAMNKAQAAQWAAKAKEARRHRAPAEAEPFEKVPLEHAWKIMSLGVVLIGIGVWRWWSTRLG